MKLIIKEKEIEVKPLSYNVSKKFRTRLEELDKSRLKIKAESGSFWTSYYDAAKIVIDMLAAATI